MTDKSFIQNTFLTSPYHYDALKLVQQCPRPDAWLAAGFVRNTLWDFIYHEKFATPINDIDVIFYDANHTDIHYEKAIEMSLKNKGPKYPWSVKNQARMHVKYGRDPYTDTADAIYHWCESVTPVAIRLKDDSILETLAPLGFDDIFAGVCHPSPAAKNNAAIYKSYLQRMKEKKWWEIWPDLKVYDLENNPLHATMTQNKIV